MVRGVSELELTGFYKCFTREWGFTSQLATLIQKQWQDIFKVTFL